MKGSICSWMSECIVVVVILVDFFFLQDDLLKILGEKHPLYDFMGMLSTKCSYLLFNKEYVKEILSEASTQKSVGDVKYISSCMSLLAVKFTSLCFI